MAIFASLSAKLQEAFHQLRRKGKLTEDDIRVAMREVRLALLEADVNFKVVKDFVNRVSERAVGQEVLQSLSPAQQVIKIVHEELVQLMQGDQQAKQLQVAKPPAVVMLVGLQGTGKTTTVGKLGMHYQKMGKRPLMVAADIYRPAAIKQLQVLGQQLDVPVFSMGDQVNPVAIVQAAVKYAQEHDRDPVLVDTAGRLQINDELMQELNSIKQHVNIQQTLLVVDAMAGQDAVNVAATFHQQLALNGIIMTKMDGDTRGGAALSVRAVTGCPIVYAGMGEKLEALETFHPDRIASRILGMGDVLTLIEKAQQTFDVEKSKQLEAKLRQNQFTLEDFLDQLQQMKNLGPMENILEMIPGLGRQVNKLQVDAKDLVRTEAIIRSMTPVERQRPDIINGSRKRRIALGSGTHVQDVNRLLKQFGDAKRLMRQFGDQLSESKRKPGKKRKGLPGFPFLR